MLLRSIGVTRRTVARLGLIAAALLLAACSDALDDEPAEPTPTAPAAPSDSPTPDAGSPTPPVPTPTPEADPTVAPISSQDFCAQAQLSITRWDLPPVLTDEIQSGSIELRYRLPPGVETLTLWMGATIEVGLVTFGDVLQLDPALSQTFPNADPNAVFPGPSRATASKWSSTRSCTRSRWRSRSRRGELRSNGGVGWSRLSPPPFAIGEPWIAATFRADGVRVRMDGTHCTPSSRRCHSRRRFSSPARLG